MPNYENFKIAAEVAKREKKCLGLDSDGIFIVYAPNNQDFGGQACCWSIDLSQKEIEVSLAAFDAICILGGFEMVVI